MTSMLVSESQQKNIEVTHDALKEFYSANAPDKLAEMDDKKLQDILDKAGKGGGPGHYNLVKALKKKYNGKAPKTRARIVAAEGKPEEKAQAKPSASSSSSSKGKTDNNMPNLHLASVEQLEAEISKRREQEEERRAEAETDDDDEPHFPIYEEKNRTLINGAEQMVIIGAFKLSILLPSITRIKAAEQTYSVRASQLLPMILRLHYLLHEDSALKIASTFKFSRFWIYCVTGLEHLGISEQSDAQ